MEILLRAPVCEIVREPIFPDADGYHDMLDTN